MTKEFKVRVKTKANGQIFISKFEDDLWLSVWGDIAHCSTQLTREQVVQLRDVFNQFLSLEPWTMTGG